MNSEQHLQQVLADGVAKKLSFAKKVAALTSKGFTTPPSPAPALTASSTAEASKEPSVPGLTAPMTLGSKAASTSTSTKVPASGPKQA